MLAQNNTLMDTLLGQKNECLDKIDGLRTELVDLIKEKKQRKRVGPKSEDWEGKRD